MGRRVKRLERRQQQEDRRTLDHEWHGSHKLHRKQPPQRRSLLLYLIASKGAQQQLCLLRGQSKLLRIDDYFEELALPRFRFLECAACRWVLIEARVKSLLELTLRQREATGNHSSRTQNATANDAQKGKDQSTGKKNASREKEAAEGEESIK